MIAIETPDARDKSPICERILRALPDWFAIEAALLSKEMGGAPVKVTWTREDDLHNDFFHTVSVERLQGGLDAQKSRYRDRMVVIDQ